MKFLAEGVDDKFAAFWERSNRLSVNKKLVPDEWDFIVVYTPGVIANVSIHRFRGKIVRQQASLIHQFMLHWHHIPARMKQNFSHRFSRNADEILPNIKAFEWKMKINDDAQLHPLISPFAWQIPDSRNDVP